MGRSSGNEPAAASDRNLKVGFAAVSPFNVLDRLMGVRISTWSYRTSPDVVHIGPMAQGLLTRLRLRERQQAHQHR
jgi:hypothetical protein